jgi:polysaccharide export outer membrane protein
VPEWLLILLALFSTCVGLRAQAPQSESLVIGAGDLLHVTLFREHDLDQTVRVKDAGTISLELVGEVAVKGLSAGEAARRIADRYKAGGFLNHPQAAVMVEESARQQVAVLGEVTRPGTIPITSPRSLLDVLSEAGGLTAVADRHITIRRSGAAQMTVFLSNKPDAALSSADVLVQPGDTVLVPKAGIVYVLGDVGRPGGFVMQDDARLSLLQAVSLASGANKTANENRARLIRKSGSGFTETQLQLKNIEHGKEADPELQADDIVFVPFSLAKNIALGATSIFASASSAVIYAAH